jgi:hypothetical protein
MITCARVPGREGVRVALWFLVVGGGVALGRLDKAMAYVARSNGEAVEAA